MGMYSKLLLSSFGFCSPIMRDKLAKVISQDKSLYDKKCLVLPYAGFNAEKTFEKEMQGLTEFGFNPDKIIFWKSRLDVISETPDYIYVPGGDPFKLLKTIRKLGLVSEIIDFVKNRGVVYIGVSAGADIAAKSIEYVLQLEDNNEIDDGDFSALGLIGESVLCHYDHYSYLMLKICREISGDTVVTINDDQLIKYENDAFEYVD